SSNYEIAVADFDLDGNQDLIVGNAQSSTLSLLFGAGDGTFGPRTTLPVATGPNGLVVADLNADGTDDIATSTSTSKSLSVLLGIPSADNATFSRTFDVFVNPVSDLPVLDPSPALTLGAVNENPGVPKGLMGVQASSLINHQAAPSNYFDADGDPPGLAIVAIKTQRGTLWHSPDSGTTWNRVGSVSEASPLLVPGTAVNRLFFQPAHGDYGTIEDALTIRAWNRANAWQSRASDIVTNLRAQNPVISSDGQTLVVADGYFDSTDANVATGKARVFRWNQDQWEQLGDDFTGAGNGDQLGHGVAISSDGNTLALGEPGRESVGRVRIFQWNGVSWQQMGSDVLGSDAGGKFGWAVSLSSDGKTLIAGGWRNDGVVADAGDAKVFEWNGSDWVQVGGDLEGTSNNGRFGWAVVLSGDGQTAAVGGVNEGGSGTTRVYRRTDQAWVQTGQFSGASAGGWAGYSLSLDSTGSRLAVGSIYDDGNGNDSGRVDIYQFKEDAWTSLGTPLFGDSARDWYGASVAMSADGNTLSVGAFQGGTPTGAGYAKVYRWDGEVWSMEGEPFVGETANGWAGKVSLSGSGEHLAFSHGTNANVPAGKVATYLTNASELSLESDTVSLRVNSLNSPPTLDPINDLTIDEDAGEQRTSLIGLGPGKHESQHLRVTASSDNPTLISNPTVVYQPFPDYELNAEYGTGSGPLGIAIADLDGDSLSDMAVANEASNSISIFKGNAQGEFTLLSTLTGTDVNLAAIAEPRSIATGDFDGNNTIDLAVACWTGEILLLRNSGDATFNGTKLVSAGNKAVKIVVDDLNSDQLLDIAFVNQWWGGAAESDLGVLLGDGSGNFGAPSYTTTPGDARGLALGDFDGDQILDAVLSDAYAGGVNDGAIYHFRGKGDGTFHPAVKYEIGLEPFGVTADDLNNDGKLDLVVGDTGIAQSGQDTTKFHVLFNDGSGLFSESIELTAGSEPSIPLTADLNHDGHQDIIVSNNSSDAVSIFYSTTDGAFASAQTLSVGDFPWALGIIDNNQDSSPKIAVTNRNSNTVNVLQATQDNHILFAPQPNQYGTATITVTVEDAGLDNDLTTNADNATFSRIFEVTVNPINDAPTHDSISDVTVDEDAPQQTVNLTGISDGDEGTQALRVIASSHNPELIPNPIVTYTSPDSTGILTFTPVANQSGAATITVTVEDAGPDGELGAGTFESAVNYNTGQVGRDMVFADLNTDGNLDAIVTADNGTTV
ncbi:MAG: FG-GAP-like repeat-containing protein, partial [Rubripirellula sp.]